MHAVYNYCGFVDMFQAVNKVERAGPQSRAVEGSAPPVTASRAGEGGSSQRAPATAKRR